MNRSVLIAVCDFLILSLLSIASFQSSMLTKDMGESAPSTDVSVYQDIADSVHIVMEQQHHREQDLESSLSNKAEEQLKLEQKIDALNQENETLKSTVASKEDKLIAKDAKIAEITGTLDLEKKHRQILEHSIDVLKTDLNATKEKLKVSEEDYKKSLKDIGMLSAQADMKQQSASDLQAELIRLKEEKIEKEKEISALQEKLTHAVTQQANLEELKKEKKALEDQTRGLAQSMAEIAATSLEIQAKQQVLSNNELFAQFLDRKVTLQFKAKRKILFTTADFLQKSKAVPIAIGDQIVFLFHINDSILDWFHFEKMDQLEVSVLIDGKEYLLSESAIEVLKADPRIFIITVNKAYLPDMKTFEIEQHLSKFDDALLIKVNDEKYESFKWNLVPGEDHVFLVPSSLSSRIFGKFAPDPGDLILSRNGNVLGIMITKSKALDLTDLEAKEVFVTGDVADKESHEKNYKQWKKRRFQQVR